MSTHTPGPWTFDPANKGRTFEHLYAITSASGAAVAYVPMRGEEEEIEANARVAAASVDLLEALEAEVRECGCVELKRECPRLICARSRAAIAKAKPQGGDPWLNRNV